MTPNQKAPDASSDHYNARTYLKHFSDPNKPGFIWRYWKSNPNDCKSKSIKSVCCEAGGDYNPYFENNRPLDDYFRFIENGYNPSLKDFEDNNYNGDAKLYIASNIARMRLWTPKRKGLGKLALEKDIENLGRKMAEDLRINPNRYQEIIEHVKKVSKNPDEINAQTMANDLEDPRIRLKIDPHFSNTGLIEGMPEAGLYYYRMPWSIIHNTTAKPFITSDNPVCMLEYGNVYVPLTPKLAVLIHIVPLNHSLKSIIFELPQTEKGVETLNSNIVKFADQYVLSNVQEDWIKTMVEKFQNYKEDYSEQIVGEGSDENGNYEIIQKRFGVK